MRIFKGISLIFLSFLMLGCHLLAPVNLPPMQNYSLMDTGVISALQEPRSTKIILVNLVIADPGFDSSKMIYEMTPYDLRSYADHQWVSTPSSMLTPLLANAIRARGYFKAVVLAPFSGISDYYLDTRLVSLKQNFLQPVSQEELMLQETLINALTNQVIASKSFNITIPAPGNNAYAGVVAANHGVNILSSQIAGWVISKVMK